MPSIGPNPCTLGQPLGAEAVRRRRGQHVTVTQRPEVRRVGRCRGREVDPDVGVRAKRQRDGSNASERLSPTATASAGATPSGSGVSADKRGRRVLAAAVQHQHAPNQSWRVEAFLDSSRSGPKFAEMSVASCGYRRPLWKGEAARRLEIATAVVMGAPALVREGVSWRELRLRAHSQPVSLGPPRPAASGGNA